MLRHPVGWHAYLAPEGGDLPNGDEAYLTNAAIDPRCVVTPAGGRSFVHCPRDADGVHRLARGQVWIEAAMYYQSRDGGVRDDLTIDGYHARIAPGGPISTACTGLRGGRRSIDVTLAPTTTTVQPSVIYVFACFGAHADTALAAFRAMLRTAVIDSRPDESVAVAGAPRCRHRDLRVHQIRNEGVNSAEALMNFLVVNRAARTCEIDGFPDVQDVRARARALPFTFTRSHARVIHLYLAAGEQAIFQLDIFTCLSFTLPHTDARTASVRLPGIRRPYSLTFEHRSLAFCRGDSNAVAIDPLYGN